LPKPQNGIFIDLGNNVPATFPLKITAIGLLQIYKKGVDFLKRASVLLFFFCCVALFRVLFAYKHTGACFYRIQWANIFQFAIHLCQKFFTKETPAQ
jgi:hypothetical protein